MQRKILFGLLLVSFMVTTGTVIIYGQHENINDPLWLKAVELANQNRKWQAGSAYTFTQGFDGKHEAVQVVEEVWYKYSLTESNTVNEEIFKASREYLFDSSGKKDVTEEIQKTKAKAKITDSFADYKSANPFFPENQNSLQIEPVSQKRNVQSGHLCLGYPFTLKTKESVLRGTAWVEENTGIPYEINAQTKIKGNAVDYNGYFSYQDGAWYLNRVETKVKVSMIIFSMIMESTTTFDTYFEVP